MQLNAEARGEEEESKKPDEELRIPHPHPRFSHLRIEWYPLAHRSGTNVEHNYWINPTTSLAYEKVLIDELISQLFEIWWWWKKGEKCRRRPLRSCSSIDLSIVFATLLHSSWLIRALSSRSSSRVRAICFLLFLSILLLYIRSFNWAIINCVFISLLATIHVSIQIIIFFIIIIYKIYF